jgi:hypothetical protein
MILGRRKTDSLGSINKDLLIENKKLKKKIKELENKLSGGSKNE